MVKNIFIIGILILISISCSDSDNKNSELVYKDGDSKVQLRILSGNNYLIYDTPIRTNFEWINIDNKTGYIYGAGIKMLGTDNGITKTEINVPSNYLKNDTLEIKVGFELNGEKIQTEFLVPVRKE